MGAEGGRESGEEGGTTFVWRLLDLVPGHTGFFLDRSSGDVLFEGVYDVFRVFHVVAVVRGDHGEVVRSAGECGENGAALSFLRDVVVESENFAVKEE